MSDTTEPAIMVLATVDEKTTLAAFTNGTMEYILNTIAAEARSHVLDVTTEPGRKFMGSLAHKIARSKTALDDQGKALVSEWKSQAKVVDGERKKARDFLDGLKAEIRKPLTDFEDREEHRIEALTKRVADLQGLGVIPHDATVDDLKARRNLVKDVDLGADWQEYMSHATETKEKIINDLATLIMSAITREAEAAELVILREEAAARQKQAAEDKIRAEAGETAKRAAEEEAKTVAKEVERERRILDETARLQAEESERQIQRAIAEAEDAKLAAAAAVETERRRGEAEKEAAEQATQAREANRTHRTNINRKAAAALAGALAEDGFSDAAKAAITAIAEHKVPNVTISY